MADYGLLGGLAEGLKQGFLSYRDETKRREDLEDKRRKMAQEDEDRKARLELLQEQRLNEKLKMGLKENPENPGEWVVDPESLSWKKYQEDQRKNDAFIRATMTKEQAAEYDRIRNQQILELKKKELGLTASQKGLIETPEGVYDLSPEAKQAKDLELKQKQAQLGLIGAQTEKYKAEAKKADKFSAQTKGIKSGKPLTVGAAENLAASKSAIQSLQDMKSLTEANPEMFGKGVGLIGNVGIYTGIGDTATKAASIDADLKSKAQVIGRYLEGGKLAEGDIKRYMEMLPQRGDKPEIVKNKIASLQRMIESKYNADLQGYRESGYDIGQNQPLQISEGLIKGVKPVKKGPQIGEIKKGFRFKGGDPSQPSSWEKVK